MDKVSSAEQYYSDGYWGYIDIVYPSKYKQNIDDKSDYFIVESINSDLRHYIPIPARKSKCFTRKLDTLKTVLTMFIDAYNRFGKAKYLYRLKRKKGEVSFSVLDFI